MTEFDIQFELDWEKYSIFRKGKRAEYEFIMFDDSGNRIPYVNCRQSAEMK